MSGACEKSEHHDYFLSRAAEGTFSIRSNPKLADDEEFVLKLAQSHSRSRLDPEIKYASDRLKDNRRIAEAHIRATEGRAFHYISDRLRDDRELLILASKCSPYGCGVLKAASNRLRNDKDVLLEVLAVNGGGVGAFPAWAKRDKDLIKMTVSKNGHMLRLFDERYQDREIVHTAVTHSGTVIIDVREDLIDKEIALVAVNGSKGTAYRYLPSWVRNDREVVMATVDKSRGSMYWHLPQWAKDDREVMMTAVMHTASIMLATMSAEQTDPEMAAIAIQHAKKDLQVAMMYIQQTPNVQRDLRVQRALFCRIRAMLKERAHNSDAWELMALTFQFWDRRLAKEYPILVQEWIWNFLFALHRWEIMEGGVRIPIEMVHAILSSAKWWVLCAGFDWTRK